LSINQHSRSQFCGRAFVFDRTSGFGPERWTVMTPGHDFVTDLENAFTMGVIVFVIVILLVFFALRLLCWIRRRCFRPTYGAWGNTFQELQRTAVPQVQCSLQAERDEESKENQDDDGGPDDPTG